MINRILSTLIQKHLDDRRIIIIIGPRRVGKTTLLSQYFKTEDTIWYNADEMDVREAFQNKTSSQLRAFIGDYKKIIIDEAQRIENIGLSLKLLHDQYPGIKIFATGSSSFDLSNTLHEPLTGRKWDYKLFPLSIQEMIQHHGLLEENRLLEHRMIYGYYPEVVLNEGKEIKILKELVDGYLYKDILVWEDIKKPQKLEKLLQALAFQVGNQVSYHELSKLVLLDNETVQRYIDLLEKCFIVFTLPSFSRNLRTELKKSRKIYFYDLGIRNALINQWNPISLRQDSGALWENFLIIERMKYKMYHDIYTNQYFWRTQAQQEIDLIEEYNGQLHAYEFKWNNKKQKAPKAWLENYPDASYQLINRTNYHEFLIPEDGSLV